MRIELPAQKKQVFEMTFPIRWGDLDAMGHVNSVSYFRYIEDVRVAWMASLGIWPNPLGESYVVANAFCNFYRQLVFPGEVLATLYVAHAGRSSFEKWVTFARSERPELICAAGGATTVWVDFPAQQSAPLPPRLREQLV
jgi:acyl-CoA thioester hydrolase